MAKKKFALKKVLAGFVSAAVLASSLFAGSVFAVDGDTEAIAKQTLEQITAADTDPNDGIRTDLVSEGYETDANGENAKISIEKFVTATGTENLFNVTVKVSTVTDLAKLPTTSPDAAVVLVMDVSNSMVGDDAEETIGEVTKERLDWAKDAANSFLSDYVTEAGDAARMVSIVEFGSNAKTVLGWTDAKGENGTVSNAVSEGVAAVSNKFSYQSGGCSTEGEHDHTVEVNYLERASWDDWDYNGLIRTTCKICGVAATFGWKDNTRHVHCTYNGCTTPTNKDHKHEIVEHYSGPHGGKSRKDSGGTNIEGGLMLARNLLKDEALAGIENAYVILLTDGVPTYHVDTDSSDAAFISGSQGGGNYATEADWKDVDDMASAIKASEGFESVTLYAVGYKLGSDKKVNKKSPQDWLQEDVKVNRYFDVSDSSKLSDSFEKIAESIGSTARAWVLTDPMGNGIVYRSNPTLKDGVVKYSSEDASLTWDLKVDDPDGAPEEVNGAKVYTYTMTYQVELNTASSFFAGDEDGIVPTNGAITLTYKTCDITGTSEVWSDLKKATFTESPLVKGYLGSLAFTKTDGTNALPGATFTLTTESSTWSDEKTSADSGAVTFSDIPSGYTYTLSEVNAPVDYVKSDETWEVKVAYGETTVTDKTSPYTFVNTLAAPNTAEYKVEHYLQDSYGSSDYTLKTTETKSAAVNTPVTAVPLDFAGYTYNSEHASQVKEGTVTTDAILVLKLYYDRIKTVTYTYNDYGSEQVSIRFEAVENGEIGDVTAGTASAPVRAYKQTVASGVAIKPVVFFVKVNDGYQNPVLYCYEGTDNSASARTGALYEIADAAADLKTLGMTDAQLATYTDNGYTHVFYYTETNEAYQNRYFKVVAEPVSNPVRYRTEYWFEQTAGEGDYKIGDDIEGADDDSVTLVAEHGTDVKAVVKDFAGYTHNADYAGNVLTGTVDKEKDMVVLKVYYDISSTPTPPPESSEPEPDPETTIRIKKTWDGEAYDGDVTFVVTRVGGSREWSREVTLRAGRGSTAVEVPSGGTYEVVELVPNGYESSIEGGVTVKVSEGDTKTVNVTNTKLPVEEIPEESTPLAPPTDQDPSQAEGPSAPSEEIIDEDIPLVNPPKTGTAAGSALAVLVAAAALGAVVLRKRK